MTDKNGHSDHVEFVHRIEVGKLSPVDVIRLKNDKNNNGLDDDLEHKVKDVKPWTYKMIATPQKTSFWKAFRATLAGETTVGVIGREIKNVAKHFVPGGHLIDGLTDRVGDSLKTENDMDKPKSKSKTIIAFGLLFVVGLLQRFGVDLGLELSPDAQWVAIGSGAIGVVLRLVTKKPVKLGPLLQKLGR